MSFLPLNLGLKVKVSKVSKKLLPPEIVGGSDAAEERAEGQEWSMLFGKAKVSKCGNLCREMAAHSAAGTPREQCTTSGVSGISLAFAYISSAQKRRRCDLRPHSVGSWAKPSLGVEVLRPSARHRGHSAGPDSCWRRQKGQCDAIRTRTVLISNNCQDYVAALCRRMGVVSSDSKQLCKASKHPFEVSREAYASNRFSKRSVSFL